MQCRQELCEYWTGDGRVCACVLLGLPDVSTIPMDQLILDDPVVVKGLQDLLTQFDTPQVVLSAFDNFTEDTELKTF